MSYKFHKLSMLFPLMSEEELRELGEDIKQNGLANPIVLLDNEILDGRNRFIAATEYASLPPEYLRYKPFDTKQDALTYVVSQNVKRRHLNASQRAMLALQILPELEEQAAERQEATQFGGEGNITFVKNIYLTLQDFDRIFFRGFL